MTANVGALSLRLFDGVAHVEGFENASLGAKAALLISAWLMAASGDVLGSVVTVAVVTMLFLWGGLLRRYVGAVVGVALFNVALIIVTIPGGSPLEIAISARIALKLFVVMYASLWVAATILARDWSSLFRIARLPAEGVALVVATGRMVPDFLEAVQDITTAQRARGLSFRPASWLRRDFYEALLVPYMHHVLRSAFDVMVRIQLRPSCSDHTGIDSSLRRLYSLVLVLAAVIPWIAAS